MPFDTIPAPVVPDVGSYPGAPAVQGQALSGAAAIFTLTQAAQTVAAIVPTLQTTALSLAALAATGTSQLVAVQAAVTTLYGAGNALDSLTARLGAVGATFAAITNGDFPDALATAGTTLAAFPAGVTAAMNTGSVANGMALLAAAMAPLGTMSTALNTITDGLTSAASSLAFISSHSIALYGSGPAAGVTNAIAATGTPLNGMTAGTASLLTGVGALSAQLTNLGSGATASFGMFGVGGLSSASALTTDSDLAALFTAPAWGVFSQTGGTAVAIADSVVAVDFRREYRVSDYPVEQGGFQSYNKVQVPFDARITFAVASSLSARTAFLSALEVAVKSLDFYKVVTPEASYPSANLVHMDYRREARRGINLLIVDVWLQEVRVTASARYSTSNAQTDASQPRTNDGPQQATDVTAATTTTTTSSGALTSGTGVGTGGVSTGTIDAQNLSFGDELTGGVSPFESTMPSEGGVTTATEAPIATVVVTAHRAQDQLY